MPRSKRAKVIHLSKVGKKGKELSEKTFTNVQECASKYRFLYVFSVENMRNNLLKDVRAELSDSRMFLGKTKVMAKALGSDASSEPMENIHLLTPYMTGSIGLLFTPRPPDEVKNYFLSYRPMDYARAGTVATRSFTIPAGVVHSTAGEFPQEEDTPLAHSMEPSLRNLGVPTRLVRGKIELDSDYEVCKEGVVLNSAQTTLMKMFGVVSSEFRVDLRAYWDAESSEVVEIKAPDESMDVDDDSEA